MTDALLFYFNALLAARGDSRREMRSTKKMIVPSTHRIACCDTETAPTSPLLTAESTNLFKLAQLLG
jgi:hypothetical protein